MSSPYGPMVIICNTRAGGGRVRRALPEVIAHLEERGLDHEVAMVVSPLEAARRAREALEAGNCFLVAAGGDGTITGVVNGMIENDAPVTPDAVLGVVSTGTSCDFIKTFGIANTPGHAASHLDGSERFPIDIGKVTFSAGDGGEAVRYFANIASAGTGVAVTRRAARLPHKLGPMRYLLASWLAFAVQKPAQVRVDMVDRTYEGPMNTMVVANGQFWHGGMKIAPKAAPTDGLLDIQIEHASRRDAIALLPKTFRGEHIPHPAILQAKRVKVSIESDVSLEVEADGLVLGATPARFEILKDALYLKV